MFKFILNKILYSFLVVFLVILFVSGVIFSGEVDPTRLSFGQRMDEASVLAKQKALGLDQGLLAQWASYFGQLSPIRIGDSSQKLGKDDKVGFFKMPTLGNSYHTGDRVEVLIRKAFPATLILALSAFVFAICIGVGFGVLAALHYNTWIDRIIVAVSTIGYSMPSYVVAIVFAIVFAYFLEPWTQLNMQGSIFDIDDYGNDVFVLKNLILPCLALGIRPLSVITQITRSAFLDVSSEPFVKAGQAKGISKNKLILKYILRNALNPIVTASTSWLASLLAGAFFVETVFNFRGLGSLTVKGMLAYDVPVVLGCIVFTSVLFIVINIATDILQYCITPKLR